MSDKLPAGSIVIIDDDDMINEVLSVILGEFYEVHGFLDAEAALSKDVIAGCDVIITDVNLPGMDGIELLEKVRGIDANLPVIVITGFNDIDIAISALKKGAFDFILKPFKNDQILISVEKALERRRLLNENIKLMEALKAKNRELELLNEKIRARNLEIENELEIASNLQRCLFPAALPSIGGLDIFLEYRPVEKITGDFFDFQLYDDRSFSFIFADVSGHGVPAALYSAMVKTAIGMFVKRGVSPSQSMKDMNVFLIQSQKELSYNYVTIFFGYFDLAAGALTYCNAGIPAPALLKRGGDIEMLESNGTFVGIFEKSTYAERTVAFEKGDSIIFYTDGAFECADADDRIMGHPYFLECLSGMKSSPMPEVVSGLYGCIERYCGMRRHVDDITILGMSRLNN
jgi:sigma-B regulation protein RsbU (phosphoserine phosphatase)